MWTFFKYCLRYCLFVVLFVVANDCPNFYMMEFAKVVSVPHHRVRAETFHHWVWTIWPKSPLNCPTIGKCFYFLSFAIFFAGLRAALCTEKKTAISSQIAAHTKANALQDNFPTTHLRRHTHTAALGPPVKKNAGAFAAQRGIAILRACESAECCQSWGVKKQQQYFSVGETALKQWWFQYHWMYLTSIGGFS